jgi:hypothetical protein
VTQSSKKLLQVTEKIFFVAESKTVKSRAIAEKSAGCY